MMTILLELSEIVLLVKMVSSREMLRRPLFTLYLVVAIVSAAIYSIDGDIKTVRHRWAVMAAISSAVMALVIIEGVYLMCQSGHMCVTLAFSITCAAFPTHQVMELPITVYGSEVYWSTVGICYLAAIWASVVGWVIVNPAVRIQGGKVRSFDVILLAYLWIRAAGSLVIYYIPGGRSNPIWTEWNDSSQLAIMACFIAWALTDRRIDYLEHDAIAYKRREYDRLRDGKASYYAS